MVASGSKMFSLKSQNRKETANCHNAEHETRQLCVSINIFLLIYSLSFENSNFQSVSHHELSWCSDQVCVVLHPGIRVTVRGPYITK